MQAADEGEYLCVAESEAGMAERTITLKVQGESYLYFCQKKKKKTKEKSYEYLGNLTATTQATENKIGV